MAKRMFDILKKHEGALADLCRAGVISPRHIAAKEAFERLQAGARPAKVAHDMKCATRTIRSYVQLMKTEI